MTSGFGNTFEHWSEKSQKNYISKFKKINPNTNNRLGIVIDNEENWQIII